MRSEARYLLQPLFFCQLVCFFAGRKFLSFLSLFAGGSSVAGRWLA